MQRRQVVDYTLQRRSVLADLYSGRTSVLDVCDAHPYLQRAAKFHGEASETSCPVCRKDKLTDVHYVYGERLKAISGQAKSTPELEELAGVQDEFTVYVVEVCRSCGWNHLAASFVMGRSAADKRPASRRAATE